ncbi:TetR/AcrR family transcriptional regulator [bacterium]|nr:TetR/AcrR family transcriptional regulator [bacterium]
MATSERKKRQIKQREEMILDIARKMLVERGYPGMSMDRLADATEYSKGTIYQHFTCKEDLVLALSIQTMSKREEFFRRASTFQGRTRERIVAVGVAEDLFVRIYPYHFRSEQIVRLTSLRDKVTPLRNETLDACERRCLSTVAEIVRTAVGQGDVVLRDGMTPEDVCFGLWCMTMGAHTLMASEIPLSERGVRDGSKSLRFATKYFLDGMEWTPLMNDVDFGATVVRIREEIFPAETQQVFGGRVAEKSLPSLPRQVSSS